ncbi:MAG: hypothetical protein Q4F76_09160, partial [Lachnospiraceae bacterium]|nr:hypothetical protein [Lachnospiraceae bacterium]
RRVCPSEARVLAALTVRKHRIAGKNPIAAGDFQWIFARNCEGTEQLRLGKQSATVKRILQGMQKSASGKGGDR